ncbi:hypothetical protein LCGC14_1745010 [marine sediment metagenome]|uniref:Uncharacterized protein n=1 Tax=marine sediment metagenome TaxID=412755 RepID=A0A0F9JKV8_9ZZZZ
MKTIITDTGWKETTTKIFKVEKRFTSALMTIGEYLEVVERLQLKGRARCQCCQVLWGVINGKIYLVATNDGNKAVCGPCYDRFKGIPRV